jgi:hypothetical protein
MSVVVGMAQSVGRRATSWMAGVRFPAGAKDFSLLHSVQVGSGAHPAFLSKGYSEVKRQGHVADHLPPSSAEVKKGGVIPPLHNMFSWHST